MPGSTIVDRDELRAFVVRVVAAGDSQLAKAIQAEFGVSRPTAHNYIRSLIDDGTIERTGMGRYTLGTHTAELTYKVDGLEEHEVWANDIAPLLEGLPEKQMDIWHYGCTEMINNVIDHSGSADVMIRVERSAAETDVEIADSGVGIFRKIARALNLEDDRHAVLELSKGKVTTDPDNHTGEGIYFSSRVFDDFQIISGGVLFAHTHEDDEDRVLGRASPPAHADGTLVHMTLGTTSNKDLKSAFDEYATDTEDYRFDKSVVPVKLLEYGDERLVSRSQAKRLMNRFDRFRTVVLNFERVESVGQAFADEVFRVFPARHPEVEVVAINTNEQVARMINRALSGKTRTANNS